MNQSPEQYFQNADNYGTYQYLPISEVIDAITLEIQADQDHYLKGVPRHILIKYAIDGVREMNFSGNGDILALELDIGSNLQMILPQDYVDYLEVFVVGDDCKLYLLDYNSNINISPSYLQDHEFEIIFDSDGDTIDVDGLNTYNKPYTRYGFSGNTYSHLCTDFTHGFNKQQNIDTSKLSKFGEFIIDKKRGVIAFSSDLETRTIVLRYISDGLEQKNIDGERITVHKYLKEALEDYIYMRGIFRRKNVPQSEKTRANRKFKTAKHKASIKLKDINPHRIAKAMRSVFKPNKF